MRSKSLAILALASLAGSHGDAVAGGMAKCSAYNLRPRVITVVQQSLKQAGFDPGRDDGEYSDSTRVALVAYARHYHGGANKDLAMIEDLLNVTVGPEETRKIKDRAGSNKFGCRW